MKRVVHDNRLIPSLARRVLPQRLAAPGWLVRNRWSRWQRSLLSPLQLFEVELELFALKNVAIDAARLTRAGRDAGVQTTGAELISDLLLELAVGLELLQLALNGTASLGLGTGFIRFFNLLLVQLNVVLLEVVLSEGSGIDEHNGVLDEGLRAHKLVVGGVVDCVENTGLSGHGLTAPGEVTLIAAESASLDITATATNVDDLLGAELGHGGDSAHFKLSLFLVDRHAAARGSPLVPRVPRNTHTS